MSGRSGVVALAAAISFITLGALAGSSSLSGPVILAFTPNHGVHVEDVFVLLAWVGCMAWCWREWQRR